VQAFVQAFVRTFAQTFAPTFVETFIRTTVRAIVETFVETIVRLPSILVLRVSRALELYRALSRVLSRALKERPAYLRRNIAVTTRPFAIILVALELPYKVLEYNVSRLSIKALVYY
jgi:hypothetical protein